MLTAPELHISNTLLPKSRAARGQDYLALVIKYVKRLDVQQDAAILPTKIQPL